MTSNIHTILIVLYFEDLEGTTNLQNTQVQNSNQELTTYERIVHNYISNYSYNLFDLLNRLALQTAWTTTTNFDILEQESFERQELVEEIYHFVETVIRLRRELPPDQNDYSS